MTTRRPLHNKLLGRLSVDTEFGNFLGDTRIRLLEAIGRYGSITQAAKAVPLSYKAAWDAVDAMNNLADQTLVERSVGGRHGGGTRLTPYGERLIAMYRALEQEHQRLLEQMDRHMSREGSEDITQFRRLIHRMSMRTSARNQFVGTVTGLREGAVSFEVCLRLDASQLLWSVITRASAENLGLAIGREVHAFVKASTVMLLTDRAVRVSARNQLWGEVAAVHDGTVNSEVSLGLPGGRSVTATVTRDSVERLALAAGTPACAFFDASNVILATFD